MKKIIVIIPILLFTTPLLAQFQLGGGLSYGMKTERAGLTLKGLNELGKRWKLSPAFTHFTNDPYVHRGGTLRFEDVSRHYSLDLDFHHEFDLQASRRFSAYTIAGVNFSFVVFNESRMIAPNQESLVTTTFNEVGINLGLGAGFQVSPASSLYYEAKAVGFSDAGQLVLNFGFITTIGAKG